MPAQIRLRLLLAVGLAPYKMVKKIALTSKLAGQFYLVASLFFRHASSIPPSAPSRCRAGAL